MNREQAEKLLAALIFDDLDEASKAELLAYLQTDDELRDRLRDLQMTVKLTGDAVNDGPEPVLPERRLKQLQQLAKTSKTTRRIFTIRPFVGVAAVLTLGLVLIGLLVPSLGGRRVDKGKVYTGRSSISRQRSAVPPTSQRAPMRGDAPMADQLSSTTHRKYTETGATANVDVDSGRAIVNGEGARESTPAAGAHYADTAGVQAMTRSNRVASDEFSTQVPVPAGAPVQMESSARKSSSPGFTVLKRRIDPAQVAASDTPSAPQPEKQPQLLPSLGTLMKSRGTTVGKEAKRMERELQAATKTDNGLVEGKSVAKSKSEEMPAEAGGYGRDRGSMGGYGGGRGVNGGMGGMGGYGGGMMGGMSRPTPPVGVREEAVAGRKLAEKVPAYDGIVVYDWQGPVTPEGPFFMMSTPTPGGPAATSDTDLSLIGGSPPELAGPTDNRGDVADLYGYQNKETGGNQDSKDSVTARGTRVDASGVMVSPDSDRDQISADLESAKHAYTEEADAGLPSQSHFRTVPVNPWVMTERDPLSTFALDVDTASYALCRRYILNGFLPPAGAVRMEEFINAFDYAYPQRDEATFAVYAEGAPAPFAPAGQDLTLLKIAVKARTVGRDQRRAAHLVFVVDASASMGQADRLPPVQSALSLLVDKLSDADRVSLVTCAGDARLHLEAVPAREKDKIRRTIEAIQPAGSTNLAAGLKLGYSLARRAFVAGQINQVVLCSDGVANVGQTQAEALLQEVAADRKQGITITCVGVGYGAYNDALLEAMADSGDGRYVFLDPSPQARETLVGQLAATLQTVARDARIQVRFDPARVRRYRLIGYENRDIEDQRFRDDTVDAGEVGSGQCSTALYELELTDSSSREGNTDLGTVFVRYRDAESERIEEISRPLSGSIVRRRSVAQDPRFFLAAGAARFAEWLRQSEHAQHTSLVEIQRLLDEVSIALPLDRDVQDLAALAHRAEGLPRAP
jgi:Ca-activated chloride channel family protein